MLLEKPLWQPPRGRGRKGRAADWGRGRGGQKFKGSPRGGGPRVGIGNPLPAHPPEGATGGLGPLARSYPDSVLPAAMGKDPPGPTAPYLEGCPDTRSRGASGGPLRACRPAPRLSRAAASPTTLVLFTLFFFFFLMKPHFKNDKERVLLIFFVCFSTTTLSL